MSGPERGTLTALLATRDAITIGLCEARDLVEQLPASPDAFAALDLIKRTAARAFLKAFEQLEDIVAKLIRVIMILEDEDLSGLSVRGMAERAEAIDLIASAERWSAIVRLRNRLVHEYPLTADDQYRRFSEVWHAQFALVAVVASINTFLGDHEYPEVGDD